MLSGVGVDQLKQGEGSSSKILSSALAFVFGLSAVFIAMGAGASAIGSFLQRNRALLAPIAGALILLFGLHLIGWLVKITVRAGLIAGAVLVALGLALHFSLGSRLAVRPIHLYATSLIFLLGPSMTRWLNRDVHLRNVGGNKPGIVSGFLLGFAFALGWTPCIGPILTMVLTLAATRENVLQGVILLTFYSAGLAIPFLLTAVLISRFMKFYQRFRKHLHTVEVCSGVLLLLIGALIFTNGLTFLSARATGLSADAFLLKMFHGKTGLIGDAGSNAPSSANLQSAPNVTFKDMQGNTVALASLKGKVVLLNFWATWCEPCRGEIPVLIKMQETYSPKGFTMLGASMDEDGKAAVDPFLAKTRFDVAGQPTAVNYPIVLGNDDIATQFGGLLGMPTSFLISRDGKIVKKYMGVVNEAQIIKDVESQL